MAKSNKKVTKENKKHTNVTKLYVKSQQVNKGKTRHKHKQKYV